MESGMYTPLPVTSQRKLARRDRTLIFGRSLNAPKSTRVFCTSDL
jgi:hypothetical protein